MVYAYFYIYVAFPGPIIEGDVESERAGKLQKQKEENGGKPLEKVPEAKKWAPVQTAPRKVNTKHKQINIHVKTVNPSLRQFTV